MRKEISQDIEEAYASGKISTSEVKDIVESAVSKVAKNAKEGAVDINDLAKEAVVATVTELKSVGSETKELIGAVVSGAIGGISKNRKDAIDEIDMELLKTKYRLWEHKGHLAAQFKDALNGAKEAASTFNDDTKDDIEDAVTETKLKSAEILGLMKETIKHSVKVIIGEGKDVEEKVAHIAHEATENALSAGRFSAQTAKEVSALVILSAVEAAEEVGEEVKETTKGALEGTKRGVLTSIEKVKTNLGEAKGGLEEEVRQTIKDLEDIEEDFTEALRKTAHKVGEVARGVIDDSINDAKANASDIKEGAEEAIGEAIEHLKERGSQAAYSAKELALEVGEVAKEEAVELAEKMVKIAKGAFSGMVEGAKKSIKDKEA